MKPKSNLFLAISYQLSAFSFSVYPIRRKKINSYLAPATPLTFGLIFLNRIIGFSGFILIVTCYLLLEGSVTSSRTTLF